MDFTSVRFDNDLTGKDPQSDLSKELLAAYDKIVAHRLVATFELGGTACILSSWNKDIP